MIRVLNDFVVIRPDAPPVKAGAIFIPDKAQARVTQGVVEQAGPGRFMKLFHRRQPLSVKAGDRVVFQPYGGQELEVGGVTVRVMREEDILATVETR